MCVCVVTIITKERIITKKINLKGENILLVSNIRMSEVGIYHELLFNISVLCWIVMIICISCLCCVNLISHICYCNLWLYVCKEYGEFLVV